MALIKHGHGEVLPEPGDDQKTAAANFTDDDRKALEEESTKDADE